jgi:myo-inositol 2-dehydrogenase/D-chiro-inositol 1-dehydrogenase
VPVLCEKPAGLTSDEVRELGALAERLGVALQVGYWRRHVPALTAMRERIQAGDFGEIAFVVAAQWDEEPPPAAFRDPRSSGGILVDMGVHEFDMVRWLTGQEILDFVGMPTEVHWAPYVDGDPESVNLVARLSAGATAVVSLARRHVPGDLCRIDLLGADAATTVTYLEPGKADEMLLTALRAQAEALGEVARGAQPRGATIADAEAALLAAERGRSVLGDRANAGHRRRR